MSRATSDVGAVQVLTKPQMRWYDSRGRVALQRLAQWLNVPWQVMAKYECLVAQEAEVRSPQLSVAAGGNCKLMAYVNTCSFRGRRRALSSFAFSFNQPCELCKSSCLSTVMALQTTPWFLCLAECGAEESM